MYGHEGFVRVKLCLIITSDSVSYGAKEDYIENRTVEILSLRECSSISLKRVVKIPNSLPLIVKEVSECLSNCDVVMITGGTGLSVSDLSFKAIEMLEGEPVPGVGEYLRFRGYESVETRATLSRCAAKLIRYPRPVIVLCTPGSLDAVEIALRDIVCKAFPHAIYDASKKSAW